ncbi:P-loop containing nucleoside triphosphate hydrolase protein [Nemania sp. NC0429]|nr:P-loop containing nucleoside triphosphate hydrolase protein [Nemania sp. NC0429]
MSRHQAYRNYDYENDLDEYEGGEYSDGEDELSPEDRAHMTASTAQVRLSLGSDSAKVTTTQIEEALWHYYYDVEKSVAYLASKYISPKSAKPPAQKKNKSEDDKHFKPRPTPSLGHFFHDMPWLNIPNDRRTIFIEPSRVCGGLLGGSSSSGKMSKLQALAAARKKKAEEQKLENRKMPSETKAASPEAAKEHASSMSEVLVERPSRKQDIKSLPVHTTAQTYLSRDRMTHDLNPTTIQPQTSSLAAEADAPIDTLELTAPSAFARTLLGPSISSSAPVPRNHYPIPYMSLTSSVADAFSEPSPDDVVLTAQSKASGKKPVANTHKKKGGADGKDESVIDGIKVMRVDDTPLPKSKNLDVINEFKNAKRKKNASFVVVGHVDAGKSTLMGRLLLDLGVVDQRTIQKYRKEAESIGKSSFALAWVLDQRSEERSRGVTIDIATNKFDTDSTSFTILDAPGHRDFIPNMIAGASQADFAILVVDATTGAFEAGLKGQTREHSLLLRSMGVSRIIVAINKLDTVDWSQERFDEISQQVSGFLTATGFQLKNVSYVPVSGLNGDNLVTKSTNPAASWYNGNPLITELEASEPMARALTKPLRMTISEVFRSAQSPLTISGRIDAGSLQTGDALLIQPSGEKAYIKSLELDSEPVDWGVAGQNIVIHLSNIDPIHVRVGDIICDPKQPIASVDTFTVKALAFDILLPMQVDVHRGRLHAAGQIVEIPALLDKVKGTVLKKKPKIVKPASVARIVVKMSSKVPLEAGQRVVLRSGGQTVAAGLLE